MILKDQMLMKFDMVNRNGRMYTKECAETIVNQINEAALPYSGKHSMWGIVGTPVGDASSVPLQDVAYKVANASIKDDKVYADIEIMENMPKGKLLKDLLGISDIIFRTNGIGNVNYQDGSNVVTDYRLLSVSAHPAEEDVYKEEE